MTKKKKEETILMGGGGDPDCVLESNFTFPDKTPNKSEFQRLISSKLL